MTLAEVNKLRLRSPGVQFLAQMQRCLLMVWTSRCLSPQSVVLGSKPARAPQG